MFSELLVALVAILLCLTVGVIAISAVVGIMALREIIIDWRSMRDEEEIDDGDAWKRNGG